MFENYDGNWEMNDDGCKRPIGQLLLGANCTKYFPSIVNRNSKQLKNKIVPY